MPGLQRSCRACVTAKRRCDLATPRCSRCRTRNIKCRYVNEPGARGGGSCYHDENRIKSPRSSAGIGRGLVACSGLIRANAQFYNPSKLQVTRYLGQATLRELVGILLSFPAEFVRTGSTSFIHANLYDYDQATTTLAPANPLKCVREIISRSHHNLQQRGRLDSDMIQNLTEYLLNPTHHHHHPHDKAAPAEINHYTTHLSHVQAAILLQILSLLSHLSFPLSSSSSLSLSRPSHHPTNPTLTPTPITTRPPHPLLWTQTHHLYTTAPRYLPPSLYNPRRAYLLAESVRRTLVVCNTLLCVYSALCDGGYATQHACIEALPFDFGGGGGWKEEVGVEEEGNREGKGGGELRLVTGREVREMEMEQEEEDIMMGEGKGKGGFERLVGLAFRR